MWFRTFEDERRKKERAGSSAQVRDTTAKNPLNGKGLDGMLSGGGAMPEFDLLSFLERVVRGSPIQEGG